MDGFETYRIHLGEEKKKFVDDFRRPYVLPGGQVIYQQLRECICKNRKGPDGGVCGWCCGAILFSLSLTLVLILIRFFNSFVHTNLKFPCFYYCFSYLFKCFIKFRILCSTKLYDKFFKFFIRLRL